VVRFAPGVVLFASGDCDDARSEAKAYIAEWGWTKEEVKMIVKDGVLMVVAK
jgi:hypothetical protein